LVDAGISPKTIKKRLKELDKDMSHIWGVLVTHNHYDHIASVGTLGEVYNIPIYSTQRILNGINENYKVTTKLYQSKRIISTEESFTIGPFTITAFLVEHDTPECVGYYIQSKQSSLFIATDLGCMNETASYYLRQATHVVIEANYDEEMLRTGPYPQCLKERIFSSRGHLSNKNGALLAAILAHAGTKRIALGHLSAENNLPELALKEAQDELCKRGLCADLLVADRHAPTCIYTCL
jgi:phosphoribosyl 1,2-cyclic phosphodiesterase